MFFYRIYAILSKFLDTPQTYFEILSEQQTLDSPYFKRAIEEKGIKRSGPISFDFDENWVKRQEISKYKDLMIGIPATEYISPPATVFTNTNAKVGIGRLSRDEETLAMMRYLEKFWQKYSK